MTAVAGVLASVLLPWLAGALAVRALWRGPGRHAPTAALVAGYGYVAGLLLATLAMRALSLAGIAWSLPLLAATIAAAAVACAWLVRRAGPPLVASDGVRDELAASPPGMRALFWLALALVAVRIAGIAVEVAVSPLRAFDAWAHWATKAIVWHEHGRMLPFVSPVEWLAAGDAMTFTDGNPRHPATIPLMQAWTASFLPSWSESWINAPWIALAIALALAFYAQARGIGASAPLAMLATWLVLSLPVLDIHVALAGAADVVLGAAYAMAAMAAWRWTLTREPAMAALAGIAAAFAIGTKAEGVLWVATLVPGIVVAVHRRAGFALVALPAVAALAYLALGPERTVVMGYWLRTRPANVLRPVLDNLFVFDNWHLAWYAVVAVAAWRWRVLLSPRIAPMTFTVVAGVALIGVVYFFSSASYGVANETLVNRMPLHFAPALAFYALSLVVVGRAPAGVQPSRQATNAADA